VFSLPLISLWKVIHVEVFVVVVAAAAAAAAAVLCFRAVFC
jgi:hypothetical protein